MNENVSEEIWKDVPNYEGLYQVSNLGRVKSLRDNNGKLREMIMKQTLSKFGYYWISLWKNGKRKMYRVHRLVALAFIPNPNNLPIINHKNEIRNDNRVENLEWCTVKYNNTYGTAIEKRRKNTDYKKIANEKNWKKIIEKIDYKKIGKINAIKLKNRKDCSKPILQFDLEGNIINEYPSINEAERQTGFQHQNICKCLKGKIKTYKGFIWKYKD